VGITVAVTRAAANVALGNQTFTAADLGGLTPAAAFFIITYCTSDGTPAADAVLGWGAATGAENQWAVNVTAEDGQGTTDTGRDLRTDVCVRVNVPGTTLDGEANFVSFNANNVIINWSTAPSAAFLVTVVLFAGTDLSAQAATFTVPAVLNNTVDVNTVGFEPDVVLTVYPVRSGDGFSAVARVSQGVVINKETVYQACSAYFSRDSVATSEVGGRITETYGCMNIDRNGALVDAGEFSAFDANGFSCTARVAGSGNDCAFLALAFEVKVPFLQFMVFSPLVMLITDLPIAFAGFGTATLAWVIFFRDYGSTEDLAALTLFLPFTRSVCRALIGLVSLRPAFQDISTLSLTPGTETEQPAPTTIEEKET